MDRNPDFMVARLKVWVEGPYLEDTATGAEGDLLRIKAMCEAPEGTAETEGPILRRREIAEFLDACVALSERRGGSARLHSGEPGLDVSLRATDTPEGIEAWIRMHPEPARERAFEFAIDREHLPHIIRGLTSVLDRYPVRGRER